MNARTDRCDHKRIDEFLRSEPDELSDASLVAHLDVCSGCRDYMEQSAADPQSWSDAAACLLASEFDRSSSIEYSAASMEIGKPDVPTSIQNVLDSLAPSDDPHRLGRLGGYEISGIVGVGGMGVVLKAFDPALDRVVAIKVMAPHLASHATARKRFAREAKAAAAVLHPNVIPIHSVSSEDATPYLVMGYVRGGSLQKRLDREGTLSTVEILRIGSQIAAGLAAAHGQGLVHRDIKPENILLEDGVERVTLTDFGLARTVDDASLTQHGAIAGTPQYMSPEQAHGDSIDQASDLFSLGSVLYTLCTGRVPFRAESSHGVMRKIIDEDPIPIRELNPEIPGWLCELIAKLMAKSKANRFQSAQEVHLLFEACLSHVQQPTSVDLPVSLRSDSRSSFRKPRLLLLGTIAVMTMSVLILWMTGGLGLMLQQQVTSQEQGESSPTQRQVVRSEAPDQEDEPRETRPKPLTWRDLLGKEPPEGYPKEPLLLIDGLNKSRGSWIFAGAREAESENTNFEANLFVQGGFRNQLATGGFPGWQLALQWPRDEPQHAWKLSVMALPEPDGIKLMLVSLYADKNADSAIAKRQFFEGTWNAETRILTWASSNPQLPGTEGDQESADNAKQGGHEFKMVVKANGELQIQDFRLTEAFLLSGQTAARVGEPYVEQDLNQVTLPDGYEIFFASRSQVCLVDEKAVVAGARVDKIGSEGNLIFGLITQRDGVDEPEDTLGYFWLDASTGKITKGMELADWRKALQAAGVDDPRLVAPEQVGPKYSTPTNEPKAKIIESKRIWETDQKVKSTDLVRYRDEWVCVMQTDSGLHLIGSKSGEPETWRHLSTVVSSNANFPLVDPRLSVTHAGPSEDLRGRLMLTAVEPRAPRGGTSRTWLSKPFYEDEVTLDWEDPIDSADRHYLVSSVFWHVGMAYNFQRGSIDGSMSTIRIAASKDGKSFETRYQETFSGFPGRGALAFSQNEGYCVMPLRDGSLQAYLGFSKAPFYSWQWKQLPKALQHPNALCTDEGTILVAARIPDDKGAFQATLCKLDPKTPRLVPLLKLPAKMSSFMGLACQGDHIFVSYHTSTDTGSTINVVSVKLDAQ